jgi:drug/metabolite transporter (DMT)-like permease
MRHLVLVSIIWGASFGLLKHALRGVDPDVVNAARMGLALLAFLPALWRSRHSLGGCWEFMALGAVQFGWMYSLYNRSFALLQGHEVALATLLTPLYVTLLDDWLQRRLRWRFLAAALLSVGGAALCVGAGRIEGAFMGLALLQGANLCFAVGQIWYRRAFLRHPTAADTGAMAWAYVGGFAVVFVTAWPKRALLDDLAPSHWLTLGWLGLVASGLCFFLWNRGARQVNAGVLAVMNDLKIPLGVLLSLLVFGEHAAWPRLLAGSLVIGAAWWLAARAGKGGRQPKEPASAASLEGRAA